MLSSLQGQERCWGMRILHVIDSLRMGGAEVLLSQMHGGFSIRGIDCEYYLLHSEKTPLCQAIVSQGGRVHAPIEASVYSPLHIFALQQHLNAFKYDVVHVHLFPAQLWAACGARLSRNVVPLVTTEHNTENRRRKGLYKVIDRWMYRQYQRIASISPATTTNLVEWLPDLQGKVVECPNGIDVEAFASASTSGKQALFSLPENTPVILCVASLQFRKGHDTLLRAIRLVPNIVLVCAGDGPLSGELHSLAEELGIASRVRFLGKRMDVPQLLKAADIYVQPSRVDGFCIAALEAMAAGKPVVASNVPGLSDLVGDAGLQFPVGDECQLVKRISTLLGDLALQNRLAHSAQQRARAFGIDKTLDCYERLYREIMEQAAK
jgi:glycosyltransferase involved in cell wall biosynthesis